MDPWYFPYRQDAAYFHGNWGNSLSTECPEVFKKDDNLTHEQMVIAFTWQIKEGTKNHDAEYIVLGSTWNDVRGRYSFDDIPGAPDGLNRVQKIPALKINDSSIDYDGTNINLLATWKKTNAEYKISNFGDIRLIAGYEIYYYQGTNAPTTGMIFGSRS